MYISIILTRLLNFFQKTMTQPYKFNYANQDLQNCSFRGKDLTGANFSGSDIRGCDFSEAILVEANFEQVKTGQSFKQLIFRVAAAICFSIFFAVALSTKSEGLAPNGASSAVSATIIFIAATYIFSTRMFAALNYHKIGSVITFGLGTIICIGFALHFLFETVKTLKNATGTSFKKAILTNAKFNNAVLQNVDFLGAETNGVEWNNICLKGLIAAFFPLDKG